MANATWWVRYIDTARPEGGEKVLSVASPDLKDLKIAHKRARETAFARLARKGIRARVISSQCVG